MKRPVRLTASLLTLLCLAVHRLPAQSDPVSRGLDFEQNDKYREAAAAYKQALATNPANVQALLGLERAYAQLRMTDSLLPILDRAIAAAPREPLFRVAQLRSLRSLGDADRARAAFDRWRVEWPRNPAPYREYMRLLIQGGETVAADSVLARAQRDFGSVRGLEFETAQLRAAHGLWELSADAWRVAVREASYLAESGVRSLSPTPALNRTAVRAIFNAPPAEVGARRILAGLELGWGSPQNAWNALRELPARDTSVAAAWRDFARMAEEADAWLIARDALLAAAGPARTPDLIARAATDALNGGDARSADTLATRAAAALDSSAAAKQLLPVRLRALAALGRPSEAQTLFTSSERFLSSQQRARSVQLLSSAWVHAGDVAKARELLAASPGGEGDREAGGWLALYDGDLKTARRELRLSTEPTPELVTALSLLSRSSAEKSAEVGAAFLALARGDTVAAASGFETSAATLGDAAPLLLATAARLHAARRADVKAMVLWKRIADGFADSPEAPEADLEWARALRRDHDVTGAQARLEHLILTFPQSALVPQARRELELSRGSMPPGA